VLLSRTKQGKGGCQVFLYFFFLVFLRQKLTISAKTLPHPQHIKTFSRTLKEDLLHTVGAGKSHTTPAPPPQMMAGSADGSWTESVCGHHYHISHTPHTLMHIHSYTGLWLQSNQQKRLWVEAIL